MDPVYSVLSCWQPSIEAFLAAVTPDAAPASDLPARLRPLRMRRKRLATVCLFLVVTSIVLGVQAYARIPLWLTGGLVALAALFAWLAVAGRAPSRDSPASACAAGAPPAPRRAASRSRGSPAGVGSPRRGSAAMGGRQAR